MTREQPPASNPTTTGLLALLSNAFRSDTTPTSKITQGITGTFLLALITLSFTATTAGAAQTREFQGTFGSTCTPEAELDGCKPDAAPLKEPSGIAVNDTTNDIYIADTGNNRIEKFNEKGEFQLTFGANVGGPAVDTCTALCKEGTKGSGPGEFEHAKYLAIDNTPGAGEGDVYVADTADNIVSKFTEEGVLVASWGNNGSHGAANGQLNGSPTTPFGEIAGIAVNTSGELYVLGVNNEAEVHVVFEFNAGGVFETKISTERFTFAHGLGVDAAGNLFKAIGSEGVAEFNSAGAGSGLEVTQAIQPSALAIAPASGESNGDLFVTTEGGALDHYAFTSTGEVVEPGPSSCPALCNPSDSVTVGFEASGLGVAASGDTFLSNAAEGKVYQYGPAVPIPDATTKAVTNPGGRQLTLEGSVNPEGLPVTKCFFEYGETTSYGKTAACEDPTAAELTGTSPVPVHAVIDGLTPGVTYDYRLVAANKNSESKPVQPVQGENLSAETQGPPKIVSATVTALTATSATLNSTIDPNNLATSYRFEYAETEAKLLGGEGTRVAAGEHGEVVQEGSLAAGTSDEFVSVPIPLEKANKHYYWRVVATSESGTTTGLQHTFIFTTTSEGLDASALPDNRSYEMVSPNRKNGALLGGASVAGYPPEVAASGERVLTSTVQCFAGARSCHAQEKDLVGSSYQFARSSEAAVCAPATPPCWHTTPLAPPTEYGQSATVEYNASSGTALFSIPTAPFGENDFYVRSAGNAGEPPAGSFTDAGPDTPPEDGAQGALGGVASALAHVSTADFSHFAWAAGYQWGPLVGGELPAGQEVYEYAPGISGRPLDVGVSGGFENGANHNLIGCPTTIGQAEGSSGSQQAMSADGRTVFFSALPGSGATCPSVPELFARVDGEEAADARTVAISEPKAPQAAAESARGYGSSLAEDCTGVCEENTSLAVEEAALAKGEPGPWRAAEFIGASEDGSDAFFVDTQQLTNEATQGAGTALSTGSLFGGCLSDANDCNLYEYQGVGGAHSALVDVSAPQAGTPAPAEGPRVQGVMALSPDGSHVYFVAKGVLSESERPGCMAEWEASGRTLEADCHAVEGEDNLYVYDTATARTSFIAVISAGDLDEWDQEPGKPANVTPDGQFMVFLSHAGLTADDTVPSGANQVFRYDAQSGGLLRMSVGNEGFNDDGNQTGPCQVSSGEHCSEDDRIMNGVGPRKDASMSDDGSRVFFTSPVGLTPHALDDVEIGLSNDEAFGGESIPLYADNVYEWELEGVGSCPTNRPAGCVFLISDGRDVGLNLAAPGECGLGSAVCLLGTDTTGNNVFIATTDQLVSADTNTELDYYDVRVCGGKDGPCIESPPPSSACSGEECHGIPAAVPGIKIDPSQTFNGAGNQPPPVTTKSLTRAQKLAAALKVCKKDKTKTKRVACEKTARKKYGPVKTKKAKKTAKKSTNNGRGK